MAGGPSQQERYKLILFKLIHFGGAVMNPRASTSERRTGAYLRNEDKVRVFLFGLFCFLFFLSSNKQAQSFLTNFAGVFFFMILRFAAK